MNGRKLNIKMLKITSLESLEKVEEENRNMNESTEVYPWAIQTPYKEICESIITDSKGKWETPLFFTKSLHKTQYGIRNLSLKAAEYINRMNEGIPKERKIEPLSISACMENGKIALKCLVRAYSGKFNFAGFFRYVGDELIDDEVKAEKSEGKLIIPEEIKNFKLTEEEIREHDRKFNEQTKYFEEATYEKPFLNQIKEYIPEKIKTPEDSVDLVYDLITNDKKVKLVGTYENFIEVFRDAMTYANGIEYYSYITVIKGDEEEESFLRMLESYVTKKYVKNGKLREEDLPALMEKLRTSLFKMYILQDLIDDPNITDIKITAPDAIRVRIKGNAYITNITFIDTQDYLRFVNMIAIRNRISLNYPVQTFTDLSDENFIQRFEISAAYINPENLPCIHIRKINKNKPMSKELMEAGMFDEKIKEYLLDCAKTSRGVVFAGPPGSGKTNCLNWFIEEGYEKSSEILIIQENSELFAYRKGVMNQSVVKYSYGNERPVSLEELGQQALVAGCNVFVIGEVKGAEICSAITLSNSGCRTALTIHSTSADETLDKMADLAMRGYSQDIVQAKRMMKSFQTIVYLENYQIKEIAEVVGFDEEKEDIQYKYIYRRELD